MERLKGLKTKLRQRLSLVQMFILFELGIGVVGLLLALTFGSIESWQWQLPQTQHWYLVIPPLLLAIFLTQAPLNRLPPLRKIEIKINDSVVGEFIRSTGIGGLFAVSLCAGIGEEVLFRGFFQIELNWIVASVIFGALHGLTVFYFVLATLAGLYLGFVFNVTGQSLILPIIIHTSYDLLALLLYQRSFQNVSQD